ncbi:hypothetical protein [Mycobacteroides abscessus]|uniref:hypothetical protein n=1 Tax=Mycobacteroides abscessus TaxID=36809 RepID=UPI000D864B85|nr:hypothetical protein [Mycobacteroides abscessus]SPX87962.1 Uncharacterised protein [Mycobacteroides abscessus]
MATPPVGTMADPVAAWAFMGANIVVAAVAVALATAWVLKHRNPVPIYCAIGGFLAMFANEPILDRLMLVWYPVNSPWVVLELYGTKMPLYLFIGYPWYVGLGAFIVHRALQRGISAVGLWKIFAAIAILDVIIELPSTAAGVHVYFGAQPNFFEHGLSITIPFVMSAVSLGCGFALHWVLRQPQRAWTPIAVTAIIPCTAVAILVGTQWPVMLAQNSTSSPLAVWLMAAVSIALPLAAMHAAITVAVRLQDSPRMTVSSGATAVDSRS